MNVPINYAESNKQKTPSYVGYIADVGEADARIPLCGTSMFQLEVPKDAEKALLVRNM